MEQIRTLLASGRYHSVQEFIETAIANQLYLEREQPSSIPSITTTQEPQQTVLSKFQNNFLRIPDKTVIHVVDEPKNESVDLERPLWGLANRLFPVKISLRVLGNMLENGSKFVFLEDFADNAFDTAFKLGHELLTFDKKAGRKRSEKLSDAMPKQLKKSDDPRARFVSQYVGGLSRSVGRLYGAPSSLKFVNIVVASGNVQQIGITRTGLEFMLLRNPILDDRDYTANTFSYEEIRFLLEHINENLSGERRGMATILTEISKGNSDSQSLVKKIGSVFGYKKETLATTQKVGLIGRMVELGLIERQRTGVNVEFTLSDLGKDALRKFSSGLVAKGVAN